MHKDHQGASDKIAIIGVSLRFPSDLADLAGFWQALIDGADLVTEIDAARWATRALRHPKRAEPGRSVTFSAGVLSQIDGFDAGFFGISPREAELLDPQQRLLLELAWEALESAHLPPSAIRGRDCGVFVGISGLDFGMRLLDDLSVMSAHAMTGNTLSIAANRLSYFFDLRGPSMAIDTACSSSLVALHQACSAIASGQASMALVGGVNLLLHPYPFVGFTKASMLSAQGRCRPFAAGADGYVRAEGAAMLVLKPLRQAERDGDPIWGVICGTGVNADGARKSGLTIPSPAAQAELMRRVLQRTGLPANTVDYIEAHGTGTRIGDPIEAQAIGQVYGVGAHRAQPLPIGSVKSNLGHMEPASGMAGLLKALLVLRHRVVPPSLHAQELNPDIEFDALRLHVAREPVPLHVENRPLRVGVNSFGFGGVNAHVLLEEYQRPPSPPVAARVRPLAPKSTAQADEPDIPVPLILSAPDDAALRALAERYHADLSVADAATQRLIAQAAWQGREWLDRRLAVPDLRAADALGALQRFAAGDGPHGLVIEHAMPECGKLAFVYSGNGAQWVGMGRKLIAASATFRQAVEQAAAAIRAHDGPDVLQALANDDPAALDDTALAQPALFALQVAITQTLRALGVQPQAACGHSVGEVAAAWAVGAMDLQTAAHVIVARSKAQALTRGTGRMAAVGMAESAMRETLARLQLDAELEIAAINSPRNLTVSGSKAALDALHDALRPQQMFFRELDLDYAFHSRRMDPIEPVLLSDLAGLTLDAANSSVPFYSTVVAAEQPATALDATYWWRNVREPVRFGPTIARMAADGYRLFVEIGPHAILQRYIDEALQSSKHPGRALPTARRDADDLCALHRTALRVALLGGAVPAQAYFPADDGWKQVRLPSYPWQRKRYWPAHTSEGYALIERERVHPLLGYRLKELPAAWENHLDPETLSWLADHRVGHAAILPGAAYLEIALAAAHAWWDGAAQIAVDHLEILNPVVFDGEHAQTLRTVLSPSDGRLRIEGRRRLSHDAWTLHARCQLRVRAAPAPSAPEAIPAPAEPTRSIDGARLYAIASSLGLDYGPSFRGLASITLAADTLHAQLRWQEHAAPQAGYVLHPAVLDQCFQATFAWLDAQRGAAAHAVAFLPVAMQRVTLHTGEIAAQAVQLRARLKRRSPRSVLADFALLDSAGQVLVAVQGVRFRAAVLSAQHGLPRAWRAQAVPAPLDGDPIGVAPAVPVAVLAEAATRGLAAADASALRHYAEELAPLVDVLPSAFARDALLPLAAENHHVDASLLAALRESHPLWRWCLDALQDDGVLQRQDDRWVLRQEELPPTTAIWRYALIECPQAWAELLRMARVGDDLRDLARSPATDLPPPAEPLPPEPGIPWYAAAHQSALHALRALLAQWPQQRRLRILDIAAAECSLLDALAGELPADRTDLVRARTTDAALAQIQTRGDDPTPCVATHIDPASFALTQTDGIPAQFDLVLLDHTLHLSPSPVAALTELATRMAPDALLLFTERIPDRASNLLRGADRSWWHAQGAALAPSLMTPQGWSAALQAAGWQQIHCLTDTVAGAAGLGSFAVLARPPSPAAQTVAQADAPKKYALIVFDDRWSPLADAVAAALARQGQPVERVEVAAQAFSDARLSVCDTAIVFPPLHPNDSPPRQWARDLDAIRRLLLAAAAREQPPRTWLLTQNAALIDPSPPGGQNPAAAALWGMVRVLRNEAPHLPLRLLDLPLVDAQTTDGADGLLAARIAHAMLHDDGEDEVLLTRQTRLASRIQPVALDTLLPTAAEGQPPDAWRLDFTLPGQLRNLHWQAVPRAAPQDDEIEIEAVAAGLNFRDLMYAMGLLSDEALEQGFAGAALGLEVAGRVVRCGPAVTRFKPGDEVLAFAGSSLASHVRVSERAAAIKPAAWSFAQAATVPTVFFTVWYALVHLARLQAGERVLIHAAAGGVGLAAIQVAKLLGAQVYASAGNADKRRFVQLLGADHVLDSRSADFDETVLCLTDGEGVDVVLNSLAGQAIERNLRVLRPFGRFVELGKRDFYEDTQVGLRPFRNNISYFGFDADQLMALRPDVSTRVFGEVMEQFAQQRLIPLPYTLYPADRIIDALRQLQQGRHIGKLVIDLRQRPAHVERAQPAESLALHANATYLVTGGLSGFGLATAQWLAQRGARHLLLLGRRGRETPGLEPALNALHAQGVDVTVQACDVTDFDAVQHALAPIGQSLPPLRGVIHAAMVLDDALLPNLDRDRFARVLDAKLGGALNLHHATLGMPLDFFVLYSSATVLLGNPGQANYVAANAALEAFARQRLAQGLPALAVAWGPIGDVGVLTQNAAARHVLESRLGEPPLQSAQALQALECLVACGAQGLAVMPLDPATLRRGLPDAGSRRFAALWRMAGQTQGQQDDGDIRAQLAQLPAEQARSKVAELLAAEVAGILRLPPDAVPHNRSLHDLGLDSLMAVELGLALEKRFGITLPAMLINDHPTVERIAERVYAALFGQADDAVSAPSRLVQTMAAQHAEPDVDAQLMQALVDDLSAKTQNTTRLIA